MYDPETGRWSDHTSSCEAYRSHLIVWAEQEVLERSAASALGFDGGNDPGSRSCGDEDAASRLRFVDTEGDL